MSDRHYPADVEAPSWARNCAFCKRPMKPHGRKYGSNACRQAAYRRRAKNNGTPEALYVGVKVEWDRIGAPAPVVAYDSQAPEKLRRVDPVINGKRFHGVQKGGAK